MSTDVTTAERIRAFIDDRLLESPFAGEDPLAAGAVDSLAVEQLVEYLETEFGIEFADEELVVENFASVDVVAALVDAKRDGLPEPA